MTFRKKGNEYLFELLIIHIYQIENHMFNCCIEPADAIHLPYRYEIHKNFTQLFQVTLKIINILMYKPDKSYDQKKQVVTRHLIEIGN